MRASWHTISIPAALVIMKRVLAFFALFALIGMAATWAEKIARAAEELHALVDVVAARAHQPL